MIKNLIIGLFFVVIVFVGIHIYKNRKKKDALTLAGRRRSIYEINYDKIKRFLVEDHKHFKADGFMDLVVEKIGEDEYSLCHYYEQNGDLMRDPEMTVRVIKYFPGMPMVEALSFQMDYPPTYQVVYPDKDHVYPKIKKDLNIFLGQWLNNLMYQGHK